MRHSNVEALLEVEGHILLCCLLQAHMDEQRPGTVAESVIGVDGRAHPPQPALTRHFAIRHDGVYPTEAQRVPVDSCAHYLLPYATFCITMRIWCRLAHRYGGNSRDLSLSRQRSDGSDEGTLEPGRHWSCAALAATVGLR